MGLFGPPDIGKLKAKRDIAGLRKALGDRKNAAQRRDAATALGDLEAADAIDALRQALLDPDAAVRQAAAGALATIGAPAVNALIGTLQDAETRLAAHDALAKIGAPAVMPLIDALHDDNRDVCEVAAAVLGEIGDARAVEPLIAALQDGSARFRAGFALGRLGAPAVEALIAVLRDKEDDVRRDAASALGQIGDPRAVEPLIAALCDTEHNVRIQAATALGEIGDPRAVEPLVAALCDSEWYARKEAAKALGKIGDVRAAEALKALLKDQAEDVRRAATLALQRIGAPVTEPSGYYGLSVVDGNVIKYSGPVNKLDLDGRDLPAVFAHVLNDWPSAHVLIVPQLGLLILVRSSDSYLAMQFRSPMSKSDAAGLLSTALAGKKVQVLDKYGAFELL